MGDRAVIHVKDSGISVYLHWHASDALDLLKEAIPGMRCNDPGYSTARLIGYLHDSIEGNTGLGALPGPKSLTKATLAKHSPGDGGVIVYDCTTGIATCHAGYLAEQFPGDNDIGIPPG